MVENIVVVMKVEEEHKVMLQEAAPNANIIYTDRESVDEETAKNADIIIGNIPPKMIAGSTKLKLLQLNSAGTDGYTVPGVLPEGAKLTNATGSYGLALSEHLLGMLLCIMKKLDLYQQNMKEHVWVDRGSVRSISGSKTLVVGFGDIGRDFAKKMHALGSTVSAVRRNKSDKPDYLDALYQPSELKEALKDADIVALCLPGTKDTYKMFTEETFGYMKKGAYFLNIGRGYSVDTDALCEALKSGKLAGAGVDVTDPEPLPADHPLWDAPNVLITPHISGGFHLRETHDRVIRIAAGNIRHCINNEPFDNEVDMETGYRKYQG